MRKARVFCSCCVALAAWFSTVHKSEASTFDTLTITNADWEIVVTSYGYSDLLLDKREGFEGREFLSGEWAAAVCYVKGGITNGPIWLEPDFIFPDWTSNSDFGVEQAINLANPMDPFNEDGFFVFQSVITNDCLRITMTYEMLDSETGIFMGGTPKSSGDTTVKFLSNRYVFKHTYKLENISLQELTNVKLFQFLHGLETDTALYDDRDYMGTFPEYRYDSTQHGQSFGFDTRSGEIVLHRDVIGFHGKRMPGAWEAGYYGRPPEDDHFFGKPSIGVHLSIEEDALDGTDYFSPSEGRWVSGAQRYDLGNLDAGASVSEDVLLTIQTSFDIRYPGVNVEIRDYSFVGTNMLRIEFEETIGGPVGFRLWRSPDLVPFKSSDCPGFDCAWEQELLPVIFNPLEPQIKWFEVEIDPSAPRAFYIIEPSIRPTPSF